MRGCILMMIGAGLTSGTLGVDPSLQDHRPPTSRNDRPTVGCVSGGLLCDPAYRFPTALGVLEQMGGLLCGAAPNGVGVKKWQGREFRARICANRVAVNASIGSNCVL